MPALIEIDRKLADECVVKIKWEVDSPLDALDTIAALALRLHDLMVTLNAKALTYPAEVATVLEQFNGAAPSI